MEMPDSIWRIRQKLISWGLATYDDDEDRVVELIESIHNQSATNIELSQGRTVNIPEGFHDGSGTATDTGLGEGGNGTIIEVPVPTEIKLQEKSIAPSSVQQAVEPDENYDGLSKVTVDAAKLQEKTVTPSASSQIIIPDSEIYGLSKVTVAAAPTSTTGPTPNLQSKTATPSISSQTIKPDSSYDGLSQVIVNAVSLQSKSTTPSTTSQTVTPSSGYLGLSSVSVGGIPSNYVDTSSATATAADIVKGKTAYVNGSKVTGTATASDGINGMIKVRFKHASTTTKTAILVRYFDGTNFVRGVVRLQGNATGDYYLPNTADFITISNIFEIYASYTGSTNIDYPSVSCSGVTIKTLREWIDVSNGDSELAFIYAALLCRVPLTTKTTTTGIEIIIS